MFSSVGSRGKGLLKQEASMSTSQRHYDHRNYKINLDDSSEKGYGQQLK